MQKSSLKRMDRTEAETRVGIFLKILKTQLQICFSHDFNSSFYKQQLVKSQTTPVFLFSETTHGTSFIKESKHEVFVCFCFLFVSKVSPIDVTIDSFSGSCQRFQICLGSPKLSCHGLAEKRRKHKYFP